MNPTARLMSRSLESTLQFIRQQIEQNSTARTVTESHAFGSTVAVETLASDVRLCTRVEIEFEDDDPIHL
jgi:hypothetical protein